MTPSSLRALHELLLDLFNIEDLKILLQRDLESASLIDGKGILRSLPEGVSPRRFMWLLIEELERRGHLSHQDQRAYLHEVLRKQRSAWSKRIDEVFAGVATTESPETPSALRRVSRGLKWSHVNRPELIAKLHARMERSRFVSVIGPQGIGKTELCIEYVYYRFLSAVERGEAALDVCWVDANDVRSHKDLVSTLSLGLGLPNEQDTTVEKHRKYLIQKMTMARSGLLVVLDDVHEEISLQAVELLEQMCELGVRLLLTARTAPEARSQVLFDVPSLSSSEAVTLLNNLYVRLQPELDLGELRESDQKYLVRICEALMGHPGCLVQAGSHFGEISPRDMAHRAKRFRGGFEEVLEVVWRRQMHDDERALVMLLAASPCGLQLRDVDELLDGAGRRDSLDVLHDLRRRAWIRPTRLSRGRDTYVRYEIMAAARSMIERFESSTAIMLARSQVINVLVRRAQALATDLHKPGWEEALDEFDLRVPDFKTLLKVLINVNLTKAAELLLALDRVLVLRGLVFERLELYNSVMDGGVEQLSDDLAAWLHLGRAMVYDRQRSQDRCMVEIRRSRAIAERSGVPAATLARVMIHWLEMVYRYVGTSAALARIDEVRSVVLSSHDESIWMLFRYIVAALEITMGDMEHVEIELMNVLQYRRSVGDRIRESYVMDHLIMLTRLRGEHELALAYVEERLKVEREIGRRNQLVDLSWSRSALLFEVYKDDEAMRMISFAYDGSVTLNDARRQAYCLLQRALLFQECGEVEKARADYALAMELCSGGGFATEYVSVVSYCLLFCVQFGGDAGRLEVSASERVAEGNVHPVIEAFLYDMVAIWQVKRGSLIDALISVEKSCRIYRDMSFFSGVLVHESVVEWLVGLCRVACVETDLPIAQSCRPAVGTSRVLDLVRRVLAGLAPPGLGRE